MEEKIYIFMYHFVVRRKEKRTLARSGRPGLDTSGLRKEEFSGWWASIAQSV
jgi:hypothetical protein